LTLVGKYYSIARAYALGKCWHKLCHGMDSSESQTPDLDSALRYCRCCRQSRLQRVGRLACRILMHRQHWARTAAHAAYSARARLPVAVHGPAAHRCKTSHGVRCCRPAGWPGWPRSGGEHRAISIFSVTLSDTRGSGRTLAEPPFCSASSPLTLILWRSTDQVNPLRVDIC
jgi:hypothetical protein